MACQHKTKRYKMYSVITRITKIDAGEYMERFRAVEKFIVFCRECPRYGRSWACPPYGYDMDAYLSGYAHAYIIGSKIVPSRDTAALCIDAESSRKYGTEIFNDARQKLDKLLLYIETANGPAKAFFAGSCQLCGEEGCTRPHGKECRCPDKIRPSLEAVGFDVVNTAKELLGMEMKWSEEGLLPEYYILTSGVFASGEIADIDEYFAAV